MVTPGLESPLYEVENYLRLTCGPIIHLDALHGQLYSLYQLTPTDIKGVLSRLSMRRELSSLEYSISHSTQTAPYTHARRNWLLFAKRQRGIFRLHVGCANTQWTSGIFSPVPQGPG